MSERSSKSQRIQIGWETAFNTVAVATRRLQALTVDFESQASRMRNFAQGYNFPSSTSFERDFTEGDLGGALMFDEVIVPLSMALGAVTPTAGTPVAAMTWLWNIPLSGDIVPKSATIEKGDVAYGERVKGAVATDLEIGWTREEVTIGGSILATEQDLAATLATAGVTAYPQVPMNPSGIGIWIDSTSAALGTSRQLRTFEGGFSLGGLYQGLWPLNELKPSHDGIISLQPESEATALMMANAAGKAQMTALKAGTRQFMRWAIKGPQIGAGPATYLFQVDMAVEVVDVDQQGDSDGIYAFPFTFAPVADETWGSAMKITVVNTQTVL